MSIGNRNTNAILLNYEDPIIHKMESNLNNIISNRDNFFYKGFSVSEQRARSKKSMRLPKMDIRSSNKDEPFDY